MSDSGRLIAIAFEAALTTHLHVVCSSRWRRTILKEAQAFVVIHMFHKQCAGARIESAAVRDVRSRPTSFAI